jgi:hypothetical protein
VHIKSDLLPDSIIDGYNEINAVYIPPYLSQRSYCVRAVNGKVASLMVKIAEHGSRGLIVILHK